MTWFGEYRRDTIGFFEVSSGPDITGDGLPDLIVAPERVLYWQEETDGYSWAPTQGYVLSGDEVGEASVGISAIGLGEAPSFLSQFALPSRLLRDVTGDGGPDVVTTRGSELWLFEGPLTDLRDMDKNQTARFEIGGNAVEYTVNDFDGDGIGDMAIGRLGAVWIWLGPLSGTYEAFSETTGPDIVLSQSGLGERVASGPDITGDGWPDLLVPWVDPPIGGVFSGAFVVTGDELRSGDLSERASAILEARESDDFANGGLVAIGDVTQDGTDDLAVIERPTSFTDPFSSQVLVHIFASPLTDRSADDGAIATITIEALPDVFMGPTPVVGPGDITGDGIGDLIVAHSADSRFAPYAGSISVFAGPVVGNLTLADATFVVNGSEGDRLGSSLSTIDDVEGDGLPELVIGAPQFGIFTDEINPPEEDPDQCGCVHVVPSSAL